MSFLRCSGLVHLVNSSLSSSYLMQTLRPQTPEVPHHVGVFHVGLGIPHLGVDEGRELHGVKGTGQCNAFYTWFMLTEVLSKLRKCTRFWNTFDTVPIFTYMFKGNQRLVFLYLTKPILAHTPPTSTHQQGIPDEENGGVVACQVPVALISVKLDCKASRVSHCVCWTWFPSWNKMHINDNRLLIN